MTDGMRKKTWYWEIWWFIAYNFGLYCINWWWKARKKPAPIKIDMTQSTIGSFTIPTPEPDGERIQVLRTIAARVWGTRVFKMRVAGRTIERSYRWPELKLSQQWQVVKLVETRGRSVLVEYFDGTRVVVKKQRTRPA